MAEDSGILLVDGPVKILISPAKAGEIIEAYGRLLICLCIAAVQLEETLQDPPGDLNGDSLEERGRSH